MAAPLGIDPWAITAQEHARYEEQFRSLKPVAGIVTGDQAKGFFLQSQLPPLILGKIWGLADTDADGKMNISEFSLACKLINLKLRGFEIPKVLPPVMLQQPIAPGNGLINATLLQSAPPPVVMPTQAPLLGMSAPLVQPSSSMPICGAMIPPVAVSTMPPGRPQVPTVPVAPIIGTVPPLVMPASAPSPVPVDLALGPMRNGSVVMGQGTLPTKIAQAPPAPAIPTMERVASLDSPMSVGSPLQEWAVPHQSKLKFTQVFNTTDRARSGYLSGPQARNIMIQTQLPQAALAQIWALADMDSDGRLSCEEFVLAMHLCDMAANGEKITATLPLELIPPTFRRQRQGSLTSGVSGSAEIIDGKEASSSLPTVTFEDKRKENFEKGQAELERRRKALLEIQRKEQEERERKEKEEQEKRERMRQEQERRRQVEFEKQLQRQREAEQEREEQRQRVQEQREAARREMERQRQLEWEKQRSQELQQRRQKEQEKVLQLKAKNQNLGIELSQLNEKVKQLSQKISETRVGVSGVKTTIDGMRTTRDAQLAEMSALKARLKEQNQRLVTLSQEKARMEARNKANMAADSANQEQVKLAFSNKQITLKQLRDRLADLEKEIEVKLDDIENNNSQLSELKQQLGQLIQECEQLYSVYEGKRYKILELKGISDKPKDPTDYTSSWGDSDWGATDQTGWDTAPATGWPDTSQTNTTPATNANILKYRALYEFVARNADELSFQPGDIILVPVNQNAEPGWLAGELHGHTGWFPESYVEPIDSPVTNGTDSVGFPPDVMIADSQNKRQLEGIAEVPENVSDNGSVAEVTGEVLPQIQDEMASPVLGQGQKVDNMEAQALYSWQGWKPSHLSFSKADIIIVSEQQEHWWFGERSGMCGWFPKSYVKLLPINKQPTELNEYCVALYPYQSVESGDLSFVQGETIIVVKKEGDWWTGVIGDRQGIFPANYVQVMTTTDSMVQVGQPEIPIEKPVEAVTTQPLAALVSPPTDQQEEIPKEIDGTPDFAAMSSAASQLEEVSEDIDMKRNNTEFFHSPKGKVKKPEIATVVAPYKATSAEQLDLQRGQLIMIRKKTSTGWWEGELQAKGKKRQVGWFPASYVKLLGGNNRGTPVMQKPEDTPPQVSSVEKVIALFPYAALNEDELTFEKDDVITVLAKEEASWWRGELNGVSGLFPSNYVGPVSAATTTSTSLDPMERKRQDYIQELISTEQAYIDDMAIVHDVFEKPLLQSSVLTQEEIYQIFVNWREILECNYVFLRSLRIRKEMSTGGIIRMIGDILCENLPQMTAYIRFCSCQLNAASFLQHKTQDSTEFKDLVRQCQADPRTKGMPLSSFLIKPMQRITKYPLIIKKILEYTPESHADYQNLEEALYKAEEFCKQVNEGVREKENSDRLEWLQQHVLCDGLEEQLTFNSLTNSLGPRKFLHFGVLHKAKSGKELMVFLMNDFLLLAQGNKSFGSNHLFLFDRQSSIQFKIYKKPLFLNDLAVIIGGEIPEETDFSRLLRLRQLKNGFIHSFIAPTITERNLWTKRLEEAKKNFLETESISLQRQQSKQAQFGACGRVLVVVVEGTELKLSGKCEAFCEVSMGSQKNRTPTVMTTANPRWNASMQFLVKDLEDDVLCITVFALGRFCPNEFLGRTEVRVINIFREKAYTPGPINKTLKLHEVNCGNVVLKLDLHLFRKNH